MEARSRGRCKGHAVAPFCLPIFYKYAKIFAKCELFCYNKSRGDIMSAKRYFKFDEQNQYLDNEADINYFEVNQARRVAVGNMLGDYDEYGYYVIDEEMVKELVAMPKIIVDSVEDVDLLRGAIKFDNFIHFMLVIEDDKAKLVLLEKINFESNIKFNVGRYSNMNEYVLQEIKIPNRDIDKNVIYSKFNIRREDEGMLYDFKDLNEAELKFYQALIKKMKYNALAQTVLLKSEKAIEIIEADYFDNVLNSFDKYAKYKEAFIKFLKSVILEKQEFIQINKPFFQKTVNEILDSAVAIYLSKLPADIRAEIEEEIRKVKETYFYEFNKIAHLQFVTNQNAKANDDSFISNIMSTQRDDNSKLITLEIEEEKLKEDLIAILQAKDKAKEEVDKKNADKKTITDDNPTLSKFFGDIKKETGSDLLKPKEETKDTKVEPAKKTEEKPTTKQTGKKDTIIARRTSDTETKASAPAPKAETPKPSAPKEKSTETNKSPATQPTVTAKSTGTQTTAQTNKNSQKTSGHRSSSRHYSGGAYSSTPTPTPDKTENLDEFTSNF